MSYHQHHHLPCPFFTYPYSSLFEKSKPIIIKITLSPLICWSAPTHCRRLWWDQKNGPGTKGPPWKDEWLVSGWLWWTRAVNPMVYIDLYSIYHGLSGFAIRFFLGSCHFEGKACVYIYIYIILYIIYIYYTYIYIYICCILNIIYYIILFLVYVYIYISI